MVENKIVLLRENLKKFYQYWHNEGLDMNAARDIFNLVNDCYFTMEEMRYFFKEEVFVEFDSIEKELLDETYLIKEEN